MSSGQPKLKHELGLLDGTMLVAGSMIGSGIFIVSADITRNVGQELSKCNAHRCNGTCLYHCKKTPAV